LAQRQSFSPGILGGGSLYVAVLGYALFVASAVCDAARWLSRERLFQWLRIRSGVAQTALLCGMIFWYASILREQQNGSLAAWRESQDKTWFAIQEMARIRLEIRSGTKILFLNDPFVDWDMRFITQSGSPRTTIANHPATQT
jgi:hypothetical protein